VKACLHCYVSGRVQGVCFRAYTRDQARKLGLTGYARNLDDGRVEVLVCGEQDAVAALRDWLWEGSPYASVSEVRWQSVPYREVAGFSLF